MQLMRFVKRSTLSLFILLTIASCASNNQLELAQEAASERAEMLDRIVPVNMNGYNLIRAKSINEQIELTLLYSGQEDVISPQNLAKNLTDAYCVDNEIRLLMSQGVKYNLSFRDPRGRSVHEQSITHANCKL